MPDEQTDESMGIEQLPQTELDSSPGMTGEHPSRNEDFKHLQDRASSQFHTPNPAELQPDAQTASPEERASSTSSNE